MPTPEAPSPDLQPQASQSDGRRAWALAAVLFLLNSAIAWPLFFIGITNHFGSVEPFFYEIADAIRARFPDPGWWPNWNLGMPFEYTYQPLLHHLVALATALTGWETAHAFHFVLAVFYCCGPVTLFFLVRRLEGCIQGAFVVAAAYSLFSPSAWLIPSIAADLGSPWLARRLHTAIVWGDGPYVSSLTLIPLALLLLDRALERRTPLRWGAAAIAMASVPLTNIPGAISLTLAIIAYALALPRRDWLKQWTRILAIGATGYLLFSPWMPPSVISLMITNVGRFNLDPFTATKFAAVVLFGLSILLTVVLLERFAASFYTRFSILFVLTTAPLVLLSMWGGISLISEASRFHLVMEMALWMAVGTVLPVLARRLSAIGVSPRARFALVAAGFVIVALIQLPRLGRFSFQQMTGPSGRPLTQQEIVARSEYKVAQWLAENSRGLRSSVSGSSGYWVNYWAPEIQQVNGCCTQNLVMFDVAVAHYLITTDDHAGDRAAEYSIAWLKALGAHSITVPTPPTTDVYPSDIRHPEKFEGVLKELWRDGGDIIYEVPQVSDSLAHVVQPGELISRDPENGLDIEPLQPYIAAISDPERPAISFDWSGTRGADLRGEVLSGSMVSVQIAYHPGWTAASPQGPVQLAKDAIGMMTLEPSCNGNCEIHLQFTGGTEAKTLRLISLIAWGLLLTALRWSGRASRGAELGPVQTGGVS